MMNIPTILSMAIIAVLMSSGCAVHPNPAGGPPKEWRTGNAKPAWVWKPEYNGKIGGVGICGRHVNGLSGQRELAIQRAIDNIAQQLGVVVQNVVNMTSSGSKDSADTRMDEYSIHTANGSTVKAAVREWWEDSQTGELYVWMVVQ